MGGTSLINGLGVVNGNWLDYDNWAAMGNPEWSSEEVRSRFKKSENAPFGDPRYRGQNGPLHVEFHEPNNPQLEVFIEANAERGRNVVDYNAETQLGVSPYQFYTKHGTRYDTGKAYIKPVLYRTNLNVSTNSYVIKILIHRENKTAYGVHFMKEGKKYVARAKMEVILSAGSISSPPLLMLSGIGPAEHLKKFNIPVLQDLSVGDNLLDHASFPGLSFEMDYEEPAKTVRDWCEDYQKGYGPYAQAANNAGLAFFRTPIANTPEGVPDGELYMSVSNTTNELTQQYFNFRSDTYEELWGHLNTRKLFLINCVVLHPKSVGTIRLNSSSPYDYPLIDSRYLSDPDDHDLHTMYEVVKMVLDMLSTKAFRKYNVQLRPPKLRACSAFKLLSKDYWYCCIRQLTMNVFHPVGTNKMGPNSTNSVVNSKLKVHGINNLRVADASVFPTTTSGHTMASAVMVGEMVSDFIKDYYLSVWAI